MNDDYNEVQTVECPKCGATALHNKFRWNEHNGVREWTCIDCGSECEKRVITKFKEKEER